jgi:hypothetical protein
MNNSNSSSSRLVNNSQNNYRTSSVNNNGGYNPSPPNRKNSPADPYLSYKITGFIILVGILLLAFGASIASIWLRIEREHVIDAIDYTKGAHILDVSTTDVSKNTINMECDYGKVICIEKADQICSGSNYWKQGGGYDSDDTYSLGTVNRNYENPKTDPIASGSNGVNDMGYYGVFNTKTTVNVKETLQKLCGGKDPKQNYELKYEAVPFPDGMVCGEKTQLISTYTCITKGTTCE